MNRNLLEHPFDPAQIKQRRGRNGVLDYVEGHTVIARLNAALAVHTATSCTSTVSICHGCRFRNLSTARPGARASPRCPQGCPATTPDGAPGGGGAPPDPARARSTPVPARGS